MSCFCLHHDLSHVLLDDNAGGQIKQADFAFLTSMQLYYLCLRVDDVFGVAVQSCSMTYHTCCLMSMQEASKPYQAS